MSIAKDRAGRGGPGCLGTIVIIAVVIFFAGRFLPPVLHDGQFRDEMKTEARYGASLPDSSIRIYLVAQADSLGLPPDARRIVIRRRAGRPPTITISADYTVKVNVPVFGIKLLHFKPSVEEPL